MSEIVKSFDPGVIALKSNDGEILVSPGLQGRIFCSLEGELVHKLDRECAANAKPGTFNNIGGNSLWPAPEGGPFAFNYCPPDTDAWQVQEAINSACPEAVSVSDEQAVIAKDITLLNRAGTTLAVNWKRTVKAADVSALAGEYGLKAVAYDTEDVLALGNPCPPDRGIISAWSLEQFYLTDSAFAFLVFDKSAADGINTSFYGNPEVALEREGNTAIFRFTADERLQIGANAKAMPRFIGAYIPERDLLIIRQTAVFPHGKYIDIADNDQPGGPYTASDAYSVFYGASLGFFELETIAPMTMEHGLVTGSTLVSTTRIFKGAYEDLNALLYKEYNFTLK